jgi:amino acid transporter
MNQPEQLPPEQPPVTPRRTAGDNEYDLPRPEKQEIRGKLPGRERVRIVYPGNSAFRRITTGLLEATEAAEVPSGRLARIAQAVKRTCIGRPLKSVRAEQERLSRFQALAVLSSDAISSVAYATEALLLTLVAAGSRALGLTLPLSLAIIALLVIVTISYRQTIPAYPNGGGSYIVAKENLGKLPGLVAAAALLIDYVLNVAVSVAAGVHNLASLFPALSPTLTILGLDIALVALITIINLRGLRESGTIFALPTYFFIASALGMIMIGVIKAFLFHHQPLIGSFTPVPATEPLTLFLLLRSFATGCSAMTGVEAISNGVPAFQKPEARHAVTTLTWMALILGTLFFGITILALTYAVEARPGGNPTVISLIASQIFTGPLAFLYPIFQFATLGILALSAETSYSDFPRLASLLACDRFLPHQFSFKGDRLAFSVGILFLAVLASMLLLVFRGDTNVLINLFAVGVFISFTLSQAGMVKHWWRVRNARQGWRRKLVINGLGACTTLLVSLIISCTKFLSGAWMVVLLIPLLVLLFLGIDRHYRHVEHKREANLPARPQDIHHRMLVPIECLDQAATQSLAYARSISHRVTALYIAVDEQASGYMRTSWERWQKQLGEEEETHLLIIESPYRSLLRPLLAYIDTIHERYPDETLTVILPEFVVAHWWEFFLHNQTARRLKTALHSRPGIVVINVLQHLRDRPLLRKERRV